MSEHKINDLTAAANALELQEYTLHILDNVKNFPIMKTVKGKDGQSAVQVYVPSNDYLINKAREIATEIYIDIRSANFIVVKNNQSKRMIADRLEKQEKAIALCKDLLFKG